ncbi:MAG: hypothetical protein Q8O89_02075 [Nanoarchaeota archaeon]|nr:hypothetical protein [Nanoarchaeota archaeon]
MVDLVYLIKHPDASKFSADERGQVRIDFSEIEKTLKDDGYDLRDLSIAHVLIDAKVPVNHFESFLKHQTASDDSEILTVALKRGNPAAHRHQTIIRFDGGMQGCVLGYSSSYANFHKKYLPSMVRTYVKESLLTGEKSKYASPFFAITEPELYSETMHAFKDLDLKIKIIRKRVRSKSQEY